MGRVKRFFRTTRVFLRRRLRRYPGRMLFVIAGALAYGLMFAPYNLMLTPIPAFALIYLAFRYAGGVESIQLSFTLCIVIYGLTAYWTASFHPAVVLLVPLILAPRIAVGAYPFTRLNLFNPYIFGAANGIIQYLFGIFPGLPWIRIGTALASTPLLLQPASVMGELLYGSLWAFVAALLADCVTRLRRPRYGTMVALAIMAVAIGVGGYQYSQPVREQDRRLLLVQPGVESDVGASPQLQRRREHKRLISLHRQTRRYVRPGDLVLWPETSGPPTRRSEGQVHFQGQAYQSELRRYFTSDFTLISGSRMRAPSGKRPPLLNAAVQYRPDGQIIDHYTKNVMIPLAEYWPRTGLMGQLSGLRHVIGTRDFRPGDRSGNLTVDGQAVAVMICYENAFDAYVREHVRDGAGLIAVLTSDSWSQSIPAHEQHYARSRVRAVELGTTVAQVGNTGLTGVIGPRGRDRSGPLAAYQTGVVRGVVYEPVPTLFRTYGHFITASGLLLLLLAGGLSLYRDRRDSIRRALNTG